MPSISASVCTWCQATLSLMKEIGVFVGVGDDEGRLARLRGSSEGVEDLVEVVRVHLADGEPERAELVGQGLEAHGVGHQGTLLQVVAVDDRDEVLQPVVGRHHGLPVEPSCSSPVAGSTTVRRGGAVELRGQRSAHRDRQPMPQRAVLASMPGM